MAKKARAPKLSKVEQHYLKSNPEGLTNEEMAKELGISTATVYNYLKKDKPKVDISSVEEENQKLRERVKELETAAPPTAPSFDGNIGKAFKKGKQVAVILTPNASEFADESEKSHRNQTTSQKMANAIHPCKTGKLPTGKI